MSMNRLLSITAVFVVLTLGRAPTWPDDRQTQDACQDDVRVNILSCVQTEARLIRLAPNQVTVEMPTGELRQVRIEMRRIKCDVRATIWRAGEERIWSGRAVCNELVSADPAYRYSYSVWGLSPEEEVLDAGIWVWPGEMVHLFSPSPQQKVLAGSGDEPWIMDVTTPNHRQEELTRLLRRMSPGSRPMTPLEKGKLLWCGSSRMWFLPTTDVLGSGRLENSTGPRTVTIKDVRRDPGGGLAVVVTGVRDDTEYILILEGEEWREG